MLIKIASPSLGWDVEKKISLASLPPSISGPNREAIREASQGLALEKTMIDMGKKYFSKPYEGQRAEVEKMRKKFQKIHDEINDLWPPLEEVGITKKQLQTDYPGEQTAYDFLSFLEGEIKRMKEAENAIIQQPPKSELDKVYGFYEEEMGLLVAFIMQCGGTKKEGLNFLKSVGLSSHGASTHDNYFNAVKVEARKNGGIYKGLSTGLRLCIDKREKKGYIITYSPEDQTT